MAEIIILITFALLLLLGAWDAQSLLERERLALATDLSGDKLEKVAVLEQANQLEAAAELVEAGLDFRPPEDMVDPAERWRLIDRDELLRLVDEAAALPPDLQRDLADLIEVSDPVRLAKIVSETRRAPEDAALDESLSAIGQRIGAAAEAEAQMIEDMQSALGRPVSEVGGRIREDGSIVLPETVVFKAGSAAIKPRMREFLEVACEPWMRVMMRSSASVIGAQIEGHASSEWKQDTPPDEAYLRNLDLSQRRSQAVLNACLDIVRDSAVRAWAHRHLAAVGYSSARPIMQDGVEDRSRSRRVVFSIAVDSARVLEDVERDVLRSLDRDRDSGKQRVSGLITEIRDGDTFAVDGRTIRLQGVTCDERGTGLGDRATAFVRREFAGRRLSCELSDETSYDREIGRCTLEGGRDIGEILIDKEICARCARYDSKGRYTEAQARAGRWQGEMPGYCSPR